MKHLICLFLVAITLLYACGRGDGGGKYPYRWSYVSRSLREDSHVEEIAEIAKTCSEHGLNGILLSAGLDRLDLQGADYKRRLGQVKQICADLGVEIIPSIFSVGYGSSVLAHDKNLAAGIPVKDALFVVKNGEATHVADPPVSIPNGGFEKFEGERAVGFDSPQNFGEVITRDTEIVKEGKSSLRFENFDKYPREAGRLSCEIPVKPNRLYRISCWVKTEGVRPSRPFGSGNLRLQASSPDGRPLEWININIPPTSDWVEVVEGFNSRTYDKVRISIFLSDGDSGRFWVDGLKIEEIGLVNLLRRPGTPLVVRGEKSGIIYEEGRDYEQVTDPQLNFRFDHDGPPIRITSGSRIKEGERLRVSYYHGTSVYNGQVTLCMSEPKLYEIWRTQARLIQQELAPKKYFFAMDEIRNGGACKACKERNMSMAQILGDCITKAYNIIREVNPEAEIFIWSDMLDPNHNATDRRDYYYHVDGNYYGSWNYIPKDLIIACWYYKMRRQSLDHFSALGYRTIGAAYYDADDLENPKGWLKALDETPLASGIMYTTWRNKYDLLDDFGDLVSEHWKQ